VVVRDGNHRIGTTASAVCAGLEMQLTIPPDLGPAADVVAELRDRVQAVAERP